jgi:predicted TIM-barrel fold metal-dependent hydrolase
VLITAHGNETALIKSRSFFYSIHGKLTVTILPERSNIVSLLISKVIPMKKTIITSLTLLVFMDVSAQRREVDESLKMDFEEYDPVSTLVVPEHPMTKASFPFIDVHNHQFRMPEMDLKELITEMDKLNMAVMINLSGRGRNSSDHLQKSLDNVMKNYPNRFIVFTNIDLSTIDEAGWSEKTAKQIEDDYKMGARGLKIYKSQGMDNKDSNGDRIPIDDSRIDPVWARCGELGIPVLIHSADPAPFWDEMNASNERWLELKLRSGRKRDSDDASWEQIMSEQHHIFEKHPGTKFINAHLGWYANNLGKLAELMEKYPNMYAEIGAVIAELGRQPKFANEFITKYQDRIMFGKDSWVPEEYHTYFRILETGDEYFPYYKKYHAFWRMYGLGLSEEVLKKLYYKNALSIIPGIDKTLFPD